MQNQKYPNLKSWKQGQSGNPDGRKKGSKNMSTIVREMLENYVDGDLLMQHGITELTQGKSTSFARAIVSVVIHKALAGDMRAIIWLAEQQEQSTTELEVEMREPLIISEVKPRFLSAVD